MTAALAWISVSEYNMIIQQQQQTSNNSSAVYKYPRHRAAS